MGVCSEAAGVGLLTVGVGVGRLVAVPGLVVWSGLGTDVTIGVGAAILGPITIGKGSKIGGMTLVLESVPPNSVVASKPAELLVKRGETLEKHQELTQGWNGEMDYQI